MTGFARSLATEILGAPYPQKDRCDSDANTQNLILDDDNQTIVQEAVMTGDAENERHVRDSKNDPPPSKGTNEPWKRPGQTSQNPDQPEPGKRDLDQWKKSITG